jgi:hypothetical protein
MFPACLSFDLFSKRSCYFGQMATIDLGLERARDYWNEHVLASYASFKRNSSRSSAIEAAGRAWQLHSWILHELHPTPSKQQEQAFQTSLIMACPELGWMRDLIDAAKHRVLDRSSVVVAALGGSEKTIVASDGLQWQAPLSDPRCGLTIDIARDSTKHDFASALDKVIAFWKENYSAHLL